MFAKFSHAHRPPTGRPLPMAAARGMVPDTPDSALRPRSSGAVSGTNCSAPGTPGRTRTARRSPGVSGALIGLAAFVAVIAAGVGLGVGVHLLVELVVG